MSSSPIEAAAADDAPSTPAVTLVGALRTVPDPRDRRGVRHALPVILALSLAAVLAGARSFTAIGEWVSDQDHALMVQLGVTRAARPSESTIRRVLSRVDGHVLDQQIGAFMWTRTMTLGQRRVITLDGKTIRGARRGGQPAPHLVSAFDHTTATVLGQVAVAVKSNEIPAVRALLATFDLTDAVVTVDAIHTQHDTTAAIVNAGGDYVFTVKNNQPTLYSACKTLPWAEVPAHSTRTRGHGRTARRTIKVITAPTWVQLTGATQIAQLRRTVTTGGRKSVEVVYLITSADHATAPPATLAAWVLGHWGIENRIHWGRDVTYDEDRSQLRTGHGPHVMAALRNTAISLLRLAGATNIAAATRHQAQHPALPGLTC